MTTWPLCICWYIYIDSSRHLGHGYTVTALLNQPTTPQLTAPILSIIRRHAPEAELKAAVALEATFMIPFSAKKKYDLLQRKQMPKFP